jgi:Prokaryotic E2 family A/Prokaryotic homologs of the JAB domain/ThiF family
MTIEYFEIEGAKALADPGSLSLGRSQAIAAAVLDHQDFDLLSCLAREDSGTVASEFLIVDVRCDGVPSNNRHGIGFTERLVLAISPDTQQLVGVYAMRKGFPKLMHLNVPPVDSPPSLCLYVEPPRAIRRTWTAQNFLGRIQTWLALAARDELHAADQPVEQPFFVTSEELILPWNFDTLRTAGGVAFHVVRGPERPGTGRSYFLSATPASGRPAGAIAPIVLDLPTVVHGSVDSDPRTLGGLSDLLAKRGVNLERTIAVALQSQVGPHGVAQSDDTGFSVLLVELKVSRTEGGPVERVFRRAFLLLHGLLALGEACGALLRSEKRYFSQPLDGLLAAPSEDAWRAFETIAMEVHQGLDRASARRYSGLTDEGPAGVLVGAGALGGAMLDLWTRSGWGEWTVIDEDHIKPHNLVRHVARAGQLGASKALAMVELHSELLQGAGVMRAIHADACDPGSAEVRAALKGARLAVDASTTLDYPRQASTLEDVARHASVFVTPDGNGAVLLIEDDKRAVRLRTLEAQYYRALLINEWGSEHLRHNLGKYYSGASCRDISLVMPFSRIQGHAALLAEQCQLLASQPEAAIRVWSRDPVTGSVAAHGVPTHAERSMALGEMTLSIDRGLEDKLRILRASCLPAETGGVLLGYYDFNVHMAVIVDALPAPADSQSSGTSFERGVEGTMESVLEARRRTANVVGYVGEWHSHPPGHSAAPSRDDFYQLVYLAAGMAKEGLPAIQLIVGEHDLSVLAMKAP